MNYLSFKEQIEVYFRLSEKVDRYWQMFIYTNFVVAVALGSTLIAKTTAGQVIIPFMGQDYTMTFVIQIFIVIFFYIFLFMNFRALKDAYTGLNAIVTDLKNGLKELAETDPVRTKKFAGWVNSLNFAGREYLVVGIFTYSVIAVTTVILVYSKQMGHVAQ